MTFTTKDWRDKPDLSTPIDAKALEDLERRLATYVDTTALLGGSGGGTFVDIRSKGAVSGSDCTTALQAAIDDGIPVWIPYGIWIISARLYLHHLTRIYGAGRGSIVRLIPGHATDIDMLKFDDAGTAEDIVLQSFVVDGNKANQDPARLNTCVHLTGVTKPQLVDMTITGGMIEGAYVFQCPEAKIVRTTASGNGFSRSDASGIHLDSCERAYVGGTVTDNNGFHGIILSSTTDSVIEGHFSRANGFDGSRVQYSSDRNHFSLFVSDGNFRGIYMTTDSTRNHVEHSTFIHNEASGLVFNNAYDNLFTFNHVEDNQYAVETVTADDINQGLGNTFLNNRNGELSLEPGSAWQEDAGGPAPTPQSLYDPAEHVSTSGVFVFSGTTQIVIPAAGSYLLMMSCQLACSSAFTAVVGGIGIDGAVDPGTEIWHPSDTPSNEHATYTVVRVLALTAGQVLRPMMRQTSGSQVSMLQTTIVAQKVG